MAVLETTKTFVDGGHAFVLDITGELVFWDGDTHGGYICALCDDYVCMWCHINWKELQCEDRTHFETLPGLEFT